MLGPLGGDRLWSPKDLEKCRVEAQEKANAQEKGKDEGGFVYGYMYTMNNSNYGFKGDDIKFNAPEDLHTWEINGQVKEVYVAYKEN